MPPHGVRLLSTLEECMLARNALVFVVATALTAAVAGAQQPKPATSTKSSSTAQQAPAAKSTSKTSATQAVPVTSDSAKKIVMANEAGATVTSAKLHKELGKAWYNVSYKMKGQTKTMHATVDANTGAFSATPPASTKSSTKKPS
jgi:uncharacterized membrane protein YkoI